MKKLIICLAIFVCLFAIDLSIVKVESQMLEIEFLLEGYNLETVKINNQIFQKIELNNQVTTTDKIGQPELPLIVKALAVPKDAEILVEIISTDYQEIKISHPILPHQKLEVDGITENEFVIDKQTYKINNFLPEKIVDISPPMIWRDLRIVHLKVAPVLYNPVTGTLRIYKKINFKVVFSKTFSVIKISSQWLPLYREIIANFQQVSWTLNQEPDYYLMIVHQNFDNAVDSLISFYQKQNVQTEKLIVNSDWTPEQIKEEILKRYQNNSLDWVLLVGDAEHIKPYWYKGSTDSIASDAYFSFLDGDDFYAEIGIGRLSGKNNEEISQQVQKIINYQKSANGWWLNKSILIAHKEEYPDKYSKCKREIYNDTTYNYYQPEMDTLFGACGATNDDVIEAINEGVGVVNYRGHGSTRGWTGWCGKNWQAQEIDQLNNGKMTPIVFNIACLNHKFYWPDSNCLGEAWVKKYPGGAVASLGATNPSYTTPNHTYDKMLYQAIYNKGILSIGLVSNFAAAYIITKYGKYGEENVKMYCWFGDPAMQIKFDQSGYRPAYPSGITLSCFPNPAVQKVTIKYYLPTKSKICLKIYDITGQLVTTLEETNFCSKGYYQISWDGQDSQGRKVSSGIYFIDLSIEDLKSKTKTNKKAKIIWLK